MHSPARAIAFTLWQRHRRALCAVAAYVALAVGLTAVFANPDLDRRDLAAVVMPLALPCVFAACYLMTVFAYAYEAPIESRGSCFPARLFTLPVRTAALVLWPMLYGTAAVALLWLVAARFLFWPWGAQAPAVWPALLAAVVLAWAQALLWCPFGLPWLRVPVAVPVLAVPVVGTTLCNALQVPVGYLYAFLGLQLPIAYGVAYAGLAAARRGDVPGWRWLPDASTRVLPWASGRRRSFASAGRAQVWFEWRRHGLKTPILVAVLLPGFLLPLVFGKNPLLPLERTLTLSLLAPIFAAGMGVNMVGKHNPWVRDYYGVSTFTATRPLSSAALVAAKLEMALWCAVSAWAVWLALTLPALVFSGAYREVLEWWDAWTQTRPAWEVAGTLCAAVVLLFAWTWKSLVEGLCVNLTGREWVIKGAMAVGAILFSLILWAGFALFWSPGQQAFLRQALPWALGVALALKGSLAWWVVRALLRSELVPARTAFTLLGIWVGTAAGLIGLVVWLVPGGYVAPLSLAAGVVLSLPLVRLAATPLALAWDRHR